MGFGDLFIFATFFIHVKSTHYFFTIALSSGCKMWQVKRVVLKTLIDINNSAKMQVKIPRLELVNLHACALILSIEFYNLFHIQFVSTLSTRLGNYMKIVVQCFLIVTLLFILSCDIIDAPVKSEWVGLRVKDEIPKEFLFKTTGKGKADIGWWAGGYTWPGGYFIIELVDIKKDNVILRRTYHYGDQATGSDELPRFKWWHSEEQARITMRANRVYKIKLRGQGLAQPGAGFGLWLYNIGEEEPKRQGGWQGIQ